MALIGFLALMAVMGYFVVIRPSRLQRRAKADMMARLDEGAEILTVGGVYGRVLQLRDDDLDVEIAEGVVVRLNRRAIAAVEGEARAAAADPPATLDEPATGDRTDAGSD